MRIEECKSWWEVVVTVYYQRLASVTFIIDRQEETLKHDLSIQRAWLRVALADYHNEFVKVYEFFNYIGPDKNIKVKNMYNKESYFSLNAQSLINIQNSYLDQFNLVTPACPLFCRYAKYLFDNLQEFQCN